MKPLIEPKEQVILMFQRVINPTNDLIWEDINYGDRYSEDGVEQIPLLCRYKSVKLSNPLNEQMHVDLDSLYIKRDSDSDRIYLMGNVNIDLDTHPINVMGLVGLSIGKIFFVVGSLFTTGRNKYLTID